MSSEPRVPCKSVEVPAIGSWICLDRDSSDTELFDNSELQWVRFQLRVTQVFRLLMSSEESAGGEDRHC